VSALFFHFNLLRVLSAVGKEAAPFRTLEPCRYLSLPVATCRDRCDQATRAHRSRKLGLWSHFGPHVLLGERVPRDGSGETRTWGSPEALMSMKQRRPGKRIRGISLFSYDSKWFETVFIYDDLWWFMMIYDFRVQFWIFVWYPVASFSGWQYLGTPRISVPPGTTVLEPGHWWQRPIHAAWLDVDHSRHFPRNHRNI
jgi:hypothetical protein